jgi:hypothetical protein
MSRKIFGVIVLLVVIAIAITAVGIVGIGRINSSAEQLGRLAARSVNLTVMDRIVQQRAAATLRIIINSNPALIERQINEAFLPAEKAMEVELASYITNFPENPTPEMKQRPVEAKKRWDAYVAATARSPN